MRINNEEIKIKQIINNNCFIVFCMTPAYKGMPPIFIVYSVRSMKLGYKNKYKTAQNVKEKMEQQTKKFA